MVLWKNYGTMEKTLVLWKKTLVLYRKLYMELRFTTE